MSMIEPGVGARETQHVAGERARRNPWLGYHAGTAMVGAVIGYLIGHWVGNFLASGETVVQNTGQNNAAVLLALVFGVVGFLAGIGAFEYPFQKMLGLQPPAREPYAGWTRYFRMTTDHKVVGIQYLIGVLVFFFTGGLFAMAIRTELLTPYTHFFGPDVYLQVVSEHG